VRETVEFALIRDGDADAARRERDFKRALRRIRRLGFML
jgi:hypothetical protein